MPIIITFGINGSGKDTLAKQLVEHYPNIKILSGSRIMLRGLGFDVGITADSPATKEMYQHLEQTPEPIKQQMADTVFKESLLQFKKTEDLGIISSHLIIARRENGKIIYESDLVRDWFPEVFDGFVYVKGKPEEIYLRHLKDKEENKRDRGLVTVDSLRQQQALSNSEWSKLVNMSPNKSKIIYNLEGKIALAEQSFRRFAEQTFKLAEKENRSELKPR